MTHCHMCLSHTPLGKERFDDAVATFKRLNEEVKARRACYNHMPERFMTLLAATIDDPEASVHVALTRETLLAYDAARDDFVRAVGHLTPDCTDHCVAVAHEQLATLMGELNGVAGVCKDGAALVARGRAQRLPA